MKSLSKTPISEFKKVSPAVLVCLLQGMALTPGLAKTLIRIALKFLKPADRERLLQEITPRPTMIISRWQNRASL